MLNWSIFFLILTLVAGALGFFVVAGLAAVIAKVCFAVFLVMFLIGLVRKRART